MGKSSPVPYTDQNVRQAVALNAGGVSLQALARAFEIKDEDIPLLRGKLQALTDEGFAVRRPHDRYVATKPISDLVVARVSNSLNDTGNKIHLQGDGRVSLKIEGLPDDFPFNVDISKKLLRKKFAKPFLQAGERIAVVLDRRNATELIATQVIDKFSYKKSPSIVGHFLSRASTPTFTAYAPGITTLFNASGKIPKEINSKTSFLAKVPSNLDPYNPVLEIAEQKWDPDTGVPIASIIANKHGISSHHSKEAKYEAKQVTNQHTPFKGRRDLTDEKILVIDPVNARDHDDGILIERTRDGYRTLVVVSDVPYYVRPTGTLDKSAREKGFTHYFPDDTYHMLPPRLTHYASLKEGHSKPVIYVEQFWDEDFNKTGRTEVGTGVIASQKQMTYGQFQDLVDNRSPNISSYLELGDALVEKMRFEKVTFDVDDQDYRHSYSQMLVASLMIEANSAMAEHLLENNVPFLSRSHTGSDNVFAFEEFKATMEDWGYEIPDHIGEMTAENLRRIIAQAEARNDKARVEKTIRSDFLNQAVYTTIPFSHFGLNRENYGHFTSPIRRYADIIGLRGIHTSLGNHETGLSADDLKLMTDTARILNSAQDVTRRVNLDVQKYYAVRDLQRLESHSVKAMIGKIDPYRFEIILDQKYGLRKQVEIDNLPEGWKLGKNDKSLIFNNNTQFSSGHHIRIKIGNVRPHMGDWDIAGMEPTFAKPKVPAVPYKAALV